MNVNKLNVTTTDNKHGDFRDFGMEEEANSILHAHGYEFNLKEKQLEIIESIMRQDTYVPLFTKLQHLRVT